MSEFDLIKTYFVPLAPHGLDNDAAVLRVPEGKELVVTSDTLNAGVHFPAEAAPEEIAHKVLRVNLSDLASMGAQPLSYQLNIAFPERPEEGWIQKFTAALQADQQRFGIFCSGGDTTSIYGGLSVSITAMGLVDHGTAWSRSGAQDGDAIVLTGPVGDAWVGLQVIQARHSGADRNLVHDEKKPPACAGVTKEYIGVTPEDDSYFIGRYYRPTPRFIDGEGRVHAAIDVSDGFVADLGHVCTASGVSAVVDLKRIPFSPAARALIEAGSVSPAGLLTGGDDYELILAMPAEGAEAFGTVVGHFVDGGRGVSVLDESGQAMAFNHAGWQHF